MNINSKFKILPDLVGIPIPDTRNTGSRFCRENREDPKQTQNPKFKTRYIFETFEFLILDLFQHRKVYNVSPKPPPDLLRKSKRLGLRKSPITGDNKLSPKAIFLRVSGFGFRVCLILICLCFLSGCQRTPPLYKETRLLMGTFVEIVSLDKKAAPIAFNEIKRIEGLLSKYNPGSEVSKLNRFGGLSVSRDTLYILKKAGEFWRLSDGAFDITIAPIIDLWGFTDKQYYLPNEDEIKNTLTHVGFDKIIFNDRDNMVKFNLPGMKIDLGAIAKGYAVDCAIRKLKENNITNCLVNTGGNMYGLGTKFGKPWKIAIQNPRQKSFSGYIELMNNAVATSGDYEQYFMKDNRRYSHIFNPKTGHPADSKVVSATVIAPDGLTADALSTAVFILGKEKSEVLLKKFPGVKAKIIEE